MRGDVCSDETPRRIIRPVARGDDEPTEKPERRMDEAFTLAVSLRPLVASFRPLVASFRPNFAKTFHLLKKLSLVLGAAVIGVAVIGAAVTGD